MGGLQTTIDKYAALETLRKRREEHVAMATEARDGYLKQAREELARMQAAIEAGSVKFLRFSLNPPRDYTSAYDRAIEQIEAHVGDTLGIDTEAYNQLIMDEWEWSPHFAQSSSDYSPSVKVWAMLKGY